MEIIGRNRELNKLRLILEQKEACFLACYGRRRIGKTYLLREFFKNELFFFEYTGEKDLPLKNQLREFLVTAEDFFECKHAEKVTDWNMALRFFKKEFEKICHSKKYQGKKKIIFFDEIPWISSKRSGFLQALEKLWNTFLSHQNNVILIVCGSAASWMIKNIIQAKGGLHNRITAQIPMEAFSIQETQQFLKWRGLDLIKEEILKIYFVTGGVAHYLKLAQRGYSSSQYIDQQFFSTDGLLRSEFDRLYSSLFDNYKIHLQIVKTLALHPRGLPTEELVRLTKQKSGGGFTDILNELEKSGFIMSLIFLGHKKKASCWKLTDFFSIFYLNWVSPLGKINVDPNYWKKQMNKPSYHTWIGHAFEVTWLKHVEDIKRVLGISGLTTRISIFYNSKCQIDFIIQRSDKTLHLCEVKYSSDPYEMTASEIEKIKTRRSELSNSLKTSHQIFITLLTTQPAKRNKYYLSIIDQEVSFLDLFT